MSSSKTKLFLNSVAKPNACSLFRLFLIMRARTMIKHIRTSELVYDAGSMMNGAQKMITFFYVGDKKMITWLSCDNNFMDGRRRRWNSCAKKDEDQ